MTDAQRRKLQKDDAAMRDKKHEYFEELEASPAHDLIAERDKHLATLPQDAPVKWERSLLRKAKQAKKDEDGDDPTLAAMKADIKKMLIELKWAVLDSLLKRVQNGDLDDASLVALYLKIK